VNVLQALKEQYDIVKVETVDTNIKYYTKAYKISSFNHTSYQIKKLPFKGVFLFTRDTTLVHTYRNIFICTKLCNVQHDTCSS